MQNFFSCFSCGQKAETVINPQPIPVSGSKLEPSTQQKNHRQTVPDFEDDKSRSATTMTFQTTDTFLSKIQDEDSYITNKIDQIKKLSVAERKAMEQQFIKQNLGKNKSLNVYLIQKQWSQQYTAYLKYKDNSSKSIKEMRSINNSKLLNQKNALRSNLREKEDYFIINDRLWKFISQMYGGGPPIMRDIYFPVIPITIKKHEVPITGMTNPLNLCYMIAVLQCLLSNQHFAQYFYKKLFDDSKRKLLFHNCLHRLIKHMTQVNPVKMQIRQIASLIQSKFLPEEQHDAHEFLLYMFQNIQEESKVQNKVSVIQENITPESAYTLYMKNNKSIIDRLFVSQIQTRLQCLRCENTSSTFNTAFDYQIQIVDSFMEKCLFKHFQIEKVQDYDCQKCKKKTKATKQYFMTKTPNNLIINFKKFDAKGRKIQERVKYPHEIDIKKVTTGHCGDTKYVLQSVLVHKGAKSTKGHYYCYTHRVRRLKEKDTQIWHYANDQIFKELQLQDIIGRDSYILFYERK